MSGRKTRRYLFVVTMVGIVAGISIVSGWFVTPGVDRGWLVVGGVVLAVCGCVGLIVTAPRRREL